MVTPTTSARIMEWLPSGLISRTLHSIFTGLSTIPGAWMCFEANIGVQGVQTR